MYDYYEQCGSCVYYEFNGEGYKGYCSYYKSYFYPGDSCRYYSDGNNGCYITTIVCDLLGFDDNCPVLETLRKFRKDVLQTNPKYKDILYEYDIVGPQIAKNLMKDYAFDEDKEIPKALYDFYILPTVSLINEGRNTEAIKRYTQLTEGLIDTYGIERVKEIPNDYDYTKGGHGVKKLGTYRGE